MTRTTITKTADTEVTLIAVDPYTGETATRVFWTPVSGGYVREGSRHSADDRQVCGGLSSRGYTLTASNGDDLLALIRREWRAYRASAQQEMAR